MRIEERVCRRTDIDYGQVATRLQNTTNLTQRRSQLRPMMRTVPGTHRIEAPIVKRQPSRPPLDGRDISQPSLLCLTRDGTQHVLGKIVSDDRFHMLGDRKAHVARAASEVKDR